MTKDRILTIALLLLVVLLVLNVVGFLIKAILLVGAVYLLYREVRKDRGNQ